MAKAEEDKSTTLRTDFTYIRMTRMPQKGLTEIWMVENKNHGYKLGEVRWYGAFRQYSFFPAGGGLVFSVGCMADICGFIQGLQQAYRKKGRE